MEKYVFGDHPTFGECFDCCEWVSERNREGYCLGCAKDYEEDE